MFANNLKRLRSKKNMTQQTLATLLGLDTSTVGKYETGKALPPVDVLLNISKIFNVSIDYLLDNPIGKNAIILDGIKMTDDEIELVRNYRKCRPSFKFTITNLILNLSKADEEGQEEK